MRELWILLTATSRLAKAARTRRTRYCRIPFHRREEALELAMDGTRLLVQSMEMAYLVKLVPEDAGGYSIVVPGLPGCCSQGETKGEALEY
jgi:hypothetical protein